MMHMLLQNSFRPPVSTGRLIYSLSCILFALLTTFAIVLNGADCLTNIAGSSGDQVFVLKPTANNHDSYKKVQQSFKTVEDKLNIKVRENTPIGSKLADIQANDQDSFNAKIMYAIVGGPDHFAFSLRLAQNAYKVELVNEVNFDYESPKREYNIIIRATSLYLKYELVVDIQVVDENDNKPQLDDFAIVFNNYKNNFPTGPIGRVPATDADVDDQLRYRVLTGNSAQLVVVNETNGDIQLSPWLNSNVPLKAIITVGVSDGRNDVVAQLVLTVNLVTEAMLQNSVVLSLDGTSREEFLTRKYDTFLSTIARILGSTSMYGTHNIVVFDVVEGLQEVHDSHINYRPYHSGNSTLGVNVSFSARADGNDVEAYLSSKYIEEKIYVNRAHLMQALDVHVVPFQDNLCILEPCQNYQECQAIYKFEKAPKSFITTKNMIFRPIRAVQSFTCTCPPTFTGMKHKTECNLQINQCYSNPCLNEGVCHRHESGYTCECKSGFIGGRCEHSFANSTCQSIAATTSHQIFEDQTRQSTACSGKSRCVNFIKSHFQIGKPISQNTSPSGGFSCQGCPYQQWSTELCQLRARSFNKDSYVTLPSLRRRHRFHIMLQFATVQHDALLFYNGRYNDKNDFIALEIVDSYLKFSYSLGSTIVNLSLASMPVTDGNWHKVAIDYKDRNVTLLVDDCDPIVDEALAKLQGSVFSRRCSNTSYPDTNPNIPEFRILDLTSPMQLGALPASPSEFQISPLHSFVGCMSDLYIDHQLVDLYTPLQEVGTQIGCPEKRSFCQQQSCNGHPCQDAWGAAKCYCGDDYIGRSCEFLISNDKVRKFSGNSYLTFSPIESVVASTWQVSLHFRTINPSGLLMKIALDPEANILLELFNGGLKLSYRSHNMTFSKISLDDGEWHHVEVIWSQDFTQLIVDYNPNLSAQSSDLGNIHNHIIKTITIGASPTKSIEMPTESPDFTSSIANIPSEYYTNVYSYGLNGTQSFVGCIYGVNISDNTELWLTTSEERNVERGCQVADVCESNFCPPNSRCIKKGMNQRKCICNPGFVGERCISVCDLNPCQGERSRCILTASSTESPTELESPVISNANYRCECEPHKSGKNCEHQLSPKCPSNWWGRPLAGGNSSICGPCNCEESKGFDGDCDKTTGQCFCKPNHYQPTGSDYCLPCDCYVVGSLSTACNQTSGQCKCRPGVVGRRCDTCSSTSFIAEVTLRGCEVIYDACPKTFSDGIWWDKTPLTKTASQQCPPATSTGTARRLCHDKDGWQKPNLFDCISNSFLDLYNQYRFFEENKFTLTANLAMKIASNLRYALNDTISNSSTQLYGSDMYISFRLIHYLIQHEFQQSGLNLTHRQDRMYIRNIVESINYILDPAYSDNWSEISARSPNGGAEHLMKLLDIYGKVLIESHLDTFTQPFEISTKYLTFGMDILSTDQLWDVNKSPVYNNPASSPPYATDSFGLSSTIVDHNIATNYLTTHYNTDGSSVFLDYSSSNDSSPAITIPKYDNYVSDVSNTDDTTKAFIPLKALRIKSPHEILSSPLYQAKSRAKREFVLPDLKYTRQQPAIIAYSIYRSIGSLLPVNSDSTVLHKSGTSASPNAPVIWLTLKPVNGSEFLSKNIQPKINYMLKMVETTGRTRPQCAVWNFMSSGSKNQSAYGVKKTGQFTTKGCEVKGIHHNQKQRFKYDYVNCSCDHLGAVTVLMDSSNYDYLIGDDTNSKDLMLLIALGVSILTMTMTYFILSCVRGHSIKSNSNSINKNLLFILIVIEILIFYTVLSRSSLSQRENQCKIVAIFLHYFSVSLFFWLLVNAIHFYRMLTELRDINHGPMKFYHVLGYATPAFFVSVAVGLRIEQFGSTMFCWLAIHEPIIWSMFGPISFVSSATIILFLLAFCKTLPVKEDFNGADLVKNHMLINIIKTPLIGMYWIVTVYVLNEALYFDYIYIFPAIIMIKSITLFILLCSVDKHIRYNLYVSWLRFKGEKGPFLEESGNYSCDRWNSMMSDPGASKQQCTYMYPGHTGQVMTPGFQSSCTDIFRPEVLAFSAASTTSRSSATSSSAYQYHHRGKDVSRENGYGRAGRTKHRRRHKKSHHKHHHHRHHHHHHHHRSHRHHSEDYEHHDRRRYDPPPNESISQNDLASSHSSDADDVSTLPKKNFSPGSQDNKINKQNSSKGAEPLTTLDEQTLPMEISASSTSENQASKSLDDKNGSQSNTYSK